MKALTVLLLFLFLNCGNASAQFIHQFIYKDTLREVLILTSKSHLDQTLQLQGKVKAPDPISFGGKKYDFETQLTRISTKALERASNVVFINDIAPLRITDMYFLKGSTYRSDNYEDFKNEIIKRKSEKLSKKTKCATLTLYRPAPSYHLNDLVKIQLTVNDLHYEIKPSTKIRLLYDSAANINLKIKGTETDTTINLQCGKETYVRCQVYPPNTTFVAVNTIAVPISGYIRTIQIADPRIGELESSMIDLTVD